MWPGGLYRSRCSQGDRLGVLRYRQYAWAMHGPTSMHSSTLSHHCMATGVGIVGTRCCSGVSMCSLG